MKKLLVFVGESGSGKTTIVAELVKRYPARFRKVVTRTSRPMRPGEVDGEDYHFLPVEYFHHNQDLVLVKRTTLGDYYGTRKTDLYPDTCHLLLTSGLTGIPILVDLGFGNIVVVHISISKELKIAQMRQRGDTEEMILDHLESDAATTVDVSLGEVPVINLDAKQTIDEKVEAILGRVVD